MHSVDRILNSRMLNLKTRRVTASFKSLLSEKHRRWSTSSSDRLYAWYPDHTRLDGPQTVMTSVAQPAAPIIGDRAYIWNTERKI
jgi:hypothetical protein